MLAAALALAVVVSACGGTDAETATTTAPSASPATTSTTTPPSSPPASSPASTTTTPSSTTEPLTGCADVIDVTIEAAAAGFNVSATVRSADTGWEKYADLWEVRTPDGSVLGERVLAHPHVEEQPFTRSLGGVVIPDDISEVRVAARDSVAGFCGAEYVAEVPGR